jgi:hypothetical protein
MGNSGTRADVADALVIKGYSGKRMTSCRSLPQTEQVFMLITHIPFSKDQPFVIDKTSVEMGYR